MILPNEAATRRIIGRDLAEDLSQCRALLEFGLELHDPDVINRYHLKRAMVTAVMGLFAKACLSYRAVILLCEAGLDRSAAPISRSLFETFLNLTFLVRRRVSLYRFDFNNKPITKKPLDLFGKTLDTEFRTNLYCAFCILRDEKMVGQWPKTPGLNRIGRSAHRKLCKLPQPYVSALGPKWEKFLENANTCVGLHIADYAASLGRGFYMLYRSVYAMNSQSVHQSDSFDYIEVYDNVARWYTSSREVQSMLHMSSIIFFGCIEELNKRFRFGENAKERIDDFAAKLKKKKLT